MQYNVRSIVQAAAPQLRGFDLVPCEIVDTNFWLGKKGGGSGANKLTHDT